MRIVIIIGALAASTLFGGWTFDRHGPYCVFDREYTNCSYASLAACIAAASGAGGNCRENPQYFPDRQVRRQKQR